MKTALRIIMMTYLLTWEGVVTGMAAFTLGNWALFVFPVLFVFANLYWFPELFKPSKKP